MSTTNDGGPAFPLEDWDDSIKSKRRETGMSLRDWFAGMALQGMLANAEIKIERGTYASVAYRHADQMLVAREPKEGL